MIDTSNWKEFRVGDLFNIHPTKAYKLTNSQLIDGGVNPVIANSAYNNGIVGYSNQKTTEKGNMVTFSDTVDANTIFYQPNAFVGYPHVQGLYPVQFENKWNEDSYLFFVSVLRGCAISKGFDYGNKFRRDIAIELKIKLPATANGEPNWVFMESYMKSIKKKTAEIIDNLNNSKTEKNLLDISKWEEFHIYDLFDIKTGTSSDKSKMTENKPEVRLIGRIGFNNGLSKMVDRKDNIVPFKKGDISLALGGAYLGACFIQPGDFYTGEHMVALIAKNEMTFFQKLFITTIITKTARIKYRAFVDEMDSHIRNDFSFKLPVLEPHNPDYQYMETYMKSIMQKSETIITSLNS